MAWIPAGSKTTEEYRELADRLGEQVRQARIDRGLPPESPPDFVDIPLSFIIAERLLPFKAIAVKYAAIIAEGKLIRVDITNLASYEQDAQILSESKGMFCGLIGSAVFRIIRTMRRVNKAIEAGNTEELNPVDIVRHVYFDVGFLNRDYTMDANDYAVFERTGKPREVAAEEKRRLLEDLTAYQAEWDVVMAEYEERRKAGEYIYE